MSDLDKVRKFGINKAHRDLMEARLLLVSKAYSRFSPMEIKPVRGKDKLVDCFTVEGDSLLFWYNVGNNTHTEITDL